MKKKLIKFTALLILAVLSIIPLLFLKANARIVLDFDGVNQSFIVFTLPPSTYPLENGVSYTILNNSYTDNDGYYSNNLLQIRQTSDENTFQLGSNDVPFSPNIYLSNTKIYALHFYNYNNTTYIDLRDINTSYDSNSGEITYSIGNILHTITTTYNLSGPDAASNISFNFYYLSLVSEYTTFDSTKLDNSTLNYIVQQLFNYDIFNYEIINGYDNGYQDGYDIGYDTGYADGQEGVNSITPFFNLMGGVFSVVDSILAVEIVPHVKLWYFIALPLFFLILWAVLKIWKHN